MKKLILIFVDVSFLFSYSKDSLELNPIEDIPLDYQSDFSVKSDGWAGNFTALSVDDSIF